MSTATAAPKKTKASAAIKKTAAPHPPFAELVREAIVETASRDGVSRPAIKKYIGDKYMMEVTPAVITHINTAIARGAEKGDFVLPKGCVYIRSSCIKLSIHMSIP